MLPLKINSSSSSEFCFGRMEKGNAVWLNLMDYEVTPHYVWLPVELITLVFYPKRLHLNSTLICWFYSNYLWILMIVFH